MRRIFKYRIVFLWLVCLFGFMGCDGLLNQEPQDITHPDVYWKSQAEAEQALAGDYALFKSTIMTNANFLFWGEWPAMTFMNSTFWIANYIEGSGNYSLPYREPSRDWKGFYRTANWAFTIESYTEDMDVSVFDSQAEKDRIIGEAAFLRALSYFWMARIWGDVPIVKTDKPLESASQLITDDGYIVTIPRSDELDVLDYTLKAINKAIEKLQYSSPGAPDWAIKANKASAQALKTHILLWYASRNKKSDNSEKIQESIDAATAIINNSNAELIDYVNEGEGGFNNMCIGQSKTGLFEINISSNMSESYRATSSNSTPMGLTMDRPFFQSDNNTDPDLDESFYGNEMIKNEPDRENDVRKDLFFYEYDNADDGYLLKYAQTSPDPNGEGQYARFSESNILIFRLADIYLLRAEAYARLGQAGDALSDLNLIRSMANVPNYTGPTDKESLMKAIFNERAIEFVGEGQSAYDRIRMNYWDGVPWMNQNRIDKEGYFWPVDQSIISVNPKIEQTDYWKGKL